MAYNHINKHLKGAVYGNPYQAPFVENDYSQNTPPPRVKGGGPAFVNPYDVVSEHFFDPATPSDPAFSDMQAPYEQSTADPIGAIMVDFKAAQANLTPNNKKAGRRPSQ